MICNHKEIEKHNLEGGIIVQVLGVCKSMNVLHWDLEDQSIIKNHTHPQEQFGFIIKGQLDMTISGKKYSVKAGDAYFIPANAEHSFIAVGDSEAIDVFSPIKRKYANPNIDIILDNVIKNNKPNS